MHFDTCDLKKPEKENIILKMKAYIYLYISVFYFFVKLGIYKFEYVHNYPNYVFCIYLFLEKILKKRLQSLK